MPNTRKAHQGPDSIQRIDNVVALEVRRRIGSGDIAAEQIGDEVDAA
jgi:hypothetical protein